MHFAAACAPSNPDVLRVKEQSTAALHQLMAAGLPREKLFAELQALSLPWAQTSAFLYDLGRLSVLVESAAAQVIRWWTLL